MVMVVVVTIGAAINSVHSSEEGDPWLAYGGAGLAGFGTYGSGGLGYTQGAYHGGAAIYNPWYGGYGGQSGHAAHNAGAIAAKHHAAKQYGAYQKAASNAAKGQAATKK